MEYENKLFFVMGTYYFIYHIEHELVEGGNSFSTIEEAQEWITMEEDDPYHMSYSEIRPPDYIVLVATEKMEKG